MPDTGTYLVDLRFAIANGNFEEVKHIIQLAREQYGPKWNEFSHTMREAIIYDRLEILQYFYQEGADMLGYRKELERLAGKFQKPAIQSWLQKIFSQHEGELRK